MSQARFAEVAPVEPAVDSGPVPVLFIGGLGRSGSTLLERMLSQLDGVWSVGELVHLWQRGLKDNMLCGCGVPFRDCPFWRRVGQEAFGGWDAVDLAEVLALKSQVDRNRFVPLMILPALWPSYRARLERYLELLERLFRAVRLVAGQPVVVDATKHASYAYLLRRVRGLDLRVVHLIRDSRGVAFSWTRQLRRPEVADRETHMAINHPMRMSARWVSHNLLFHLLHGLGVPTLRLRYESLIRDPAGELTRVLGYAGRCAADGELGFVGDGWVELGSSHALAGNPMRFSSGRVPLRVDDEWRGKMRRRHRLATSASTWPLLLRYGYLRGGRRDR